MQRFHSEVALFERRQKFAGHYYSHNYNQPGRWRKRHPLDCGRVRCGICHGDKFFADKARDNKRRTAIRFELDAE